MKRDLDPRLVAARLAQLRACYVPEHVDAARIRLAREHAACPETIEQRAVKSLRELRELHELARYLHRDRE